MPGYDDPMFWIHLNVDYPFTLTGILYFPKIKSNIDIQKNRIQLYCNQVYVTDQVEGVVPEFMTLMQGVIDSPDIPLNVSRSYLQADSQVKKISSYISKKVAERLEKMFKSDRKSFEEKWDDIEVFIDYGMLTDEKFCEAAMKFYLFKDVNGKYYTLDEYRTLIEANQTDKDNNIIYLYATNKEAQFSYIKGAEDKGYNVLLLSGQLDNHIIGLFEQKLEKSRFVRVDSDIIDRLIEKGDTNRANLSPLQTDILTTIFKSQLPKVEKTEFIISFDAMAQNNEPAIITQNEFMRRMKDMAAMQQGMGFYGDLPDNYNFVVNTEQPIIKKIIEFATSSLEDRVTPLRAEIDTLNKEIADARKKAEDEKSNVPDLSDKETKVGELRNEEEKIVKEYASTQPNVRQVIDLALLRNGLLRGEALDAFIRRTVELM
jgi:molecular chaperone HtpG